MAFRATYIINPEGVLEHITINNMGIGRNIDETKRVLQAVQFVAEHGEVCHGSLNAQPHGDSVSSVDILGDDDLRLKETSLLHPCTLTHGSHA